MAGRGTIKTYLPTYKGELGPPKLMLAFDFFSNLFMIFFKFESSCGLKGSLSTKLLQSLVYENT